MRARIYRLLPVTLVVIVSAWIASTIDSPGDWDSDTWPKVHALAQGNVSDFFHSASMMGPFASLVQVPFVAISGGGELESYRWAAFPCLLAVGLLGLYLAGLARRRGTPLITQVLIAGLCLINPLTLAALQAGHPEELLTAALAVAAIATASEGHRYRTALLLGLAVASKQWAVIAILPVLMALPAKRLRVAVIAGAIVLALTLPALIVAPQTFSEVNGNAASTGRVVTPWSLWYPTSEVVLREFEVGSTTISGEIHEAPSLVGALSHPLIVLLAFGLPLALALWRDRFHLTGAEAMALLALLALMRSALDPVDNVYYHLPLLLSLIGWDALGSRGLPLRGLAGAAIALAFWNWSHHLSDVTVFNVAYIAVALSAGALLTLSLFRRGGDSLDESHTEERTDLVPA